MSAPRTVLLRDWEFCETGIDEWRSAAVPGHVHLDLLRHGLIEDPFVEQNEKHCQWVDERDWSYRGRFDWRQVEPASPLFLSFQGLDTICSISLNGKVVGENNSMFMPLQIDISSLVKQGLNEIRVDFQSAARLGMERKQKYLTEQGLAPDTPNFDERAFVRKAQCMFGWDWGPRLVSCGIWKPVLLVESAELDRTDRTDRTDLAGMGSKQVQLAQREDEEGASFEFLVDGKPFYALGANWIPDHSFPSQVTPERYRERLQQAKDLGMNMIRIWGGGIYEDDAFYDICDELGIFVWQDFMFACSYYPDTPEYQEEIRKEAEYQVKRLRHHPCIAIWCGNNECHQVWQDGWGGKDKQPPRFHGEVLYHEVLRDVVERLDPARPYWPGSPYGTGYCNSGKDGDQHFWDVWHGRGDWTYYKESDARFCSEFGFASSPSKATWASVGVDMSVPKEDETARWHNKTGKPFETFTGLVELHYPKATSLEEWSYYSQLNQRDAMRAAIEHYRMSGRCRGALLWQHNDCWPVESWSVLEFGGRKKAAALELPRVFAPLLVSIARDDQSIVARACLHNSSHTIKGSAVLEAFDLRTGDRIHSGTAEAVVNPEDRKELIRAVAAEDQEKVWRADFAGARAIFWDAKPTGIREIDLRVVPDGDGIAVSSDLPALDILLEDSENPETTFEPNYFSLLPGDRVSVRTTQPVVSLRARCLDFG